MSLTYDCRECHEQQHFHDGHDTCVDCTDKMRARIAALESSLAERERECERLKTLASDEANDTDELRGAIDEFLPSYLLDDGTDEPANHVETVEYAGDEIRRLTRRAEAAEVALAAASQRSEYNHQEHLAANKVVLELQEQLAVAREENERLRKRIDAEYERGFSHADSLADSYLRSRDEGRVERVAKWMRHDAFDFPGPERDFDQEWNELDEGEREAWKRDARAVLAAADGEPRGEEP